MQFDNGLQCFILGAGGQGRVVASILTVLKANLAGYIDANYQPHTTEIILGQPLLGNYGLIQAIPINSVNLFLGIGDNYKRKSIFELFFPYQLLPNLIHPTAKIESHVQFGSANVIATGAIVCTAAKIGNGVIINSGAIVEHECHIGNFAHISPGAKLAGKVKIGDYTHVGIGASIIDGVKIGKNTIIGAGSVVIDDIPDDVVAVGVPAKVIKANSYAI